MNIYKSIKKFYKEQNIDLEDNFFNIKEAVSEDNTDENLLRPLVNNQINTNTNKIGRINNRFNCTLF